MRLLDILVPLIGCMIVGRSAASAPPCVAPVLGDQRIKQIVDSERKKRPDLPPAFQKYRWEVRREGCYYGYVEIGLPEATDYYSVFKLNQQGVIVDAPKLTCPEKVLNAADLTAIVRKARADRPELPPPFPTQRIRVERLRCLYLYFEYNVPERRGDFQVFTIDPLGEFMEFSRSEPY